jgi:hypothetical protein
MIVIAAGEQKCERPGEPSVLARWLRPGHAMPIETRWTWKARTSSSSSRSGGLPKYRLNFEIALM